MAHRPISVSFLRLCKYAGLLLVPAEQQTLKRIGMFKQRSGVDRWKMPSEDVDASDLNNFFAEDSVMEVTIV